MGSVILFVSVVAVSLGLFGSLFFLLLLLLQWLRKKPLEGVVKGLRMSGALFGIGFIVALAVGMLFGDEEPQESNPPQVSEMVQASEPPRESEGLQESEPPVETKEADEEPVFTEEDVLAALRANADLYAIGCAETLIRSMLYDPASAEFYDEEILDSDDYLRYVVKLTVNAPNALGGRIENTYICNFRIYSEDTSRFTYNEAFGVMEYDSFSEKYRPEDWGMEPEDFTLEFAQLTPESVSLKTLLANAADYNGKYVVITDDLRVISNDLEDRKYQACLSTGSRLLSLGYDPSFKLDIYYSYLDDVDEWAQMSVKDHPAVRAEGVFRLYENRKNTGWLEAKKLELK